MLTGGLKNKLLVAYMQKYKVYIFQIHIKDITLI